MPTSASISRRSTAPAPSTPNRFYRQHHTVEMPEISHQAFRPHWRVKTRIDKLFAEGAIGAAVWQVAVAYRDLHSRAYADLMGTIRLDGTARAPSYRGSQLERSEKQLDAIEHLRRIARELGGVGCSLIEDLVIEDRSWAEIGRRLGIDPKTARSWCATALRRLAEIAV